MKKKLFSLRKTMFFKRFLRKSYAIFSSLRYEVCIAVLPVMCLSFAHASNALAQSNNLPTIEHNLEEMEVYGQKVSEQLGRVASPVAIISKEEIGKAPVQNIQDLLEYISSVDVRQRGTNGAQADISIRGSSSDQVLILLNGVNITDAQTGHYNLNMPIDLMSISRIEVLSGSDSRVLGSIPFGGVINIVTGESSQNGANAEVAAGDYGYVSQSANATLLSKSKKLSAFFALSRQRSDGYIDNTDFDIKNAYLHTAFSSSNVGKFQLQLGYQDKGCGANNFYSFAYPNQFDYTSSFFSALSWSKRLTAKLQLSAHAYWRNFDNRFELFRDFENAAPFYTGHNYHQTDISGAFLKADYLSVVGKSTIGINVRNEHIFSNVLGEPMNEPRPVPDENDIFFTHEKNRLLLNAFLNQQIYVGDFAFSGGLVVNYSNDFDVNWGGGLDVDYQITPALKSYAGINHTFRLPTFTDLYYSAATHISNPNLKPEQATILEVGGNYSQRGLVVDACFFYRSVNDVIDWVKMPDSIKWESRNYTKINAWGIDMNAQYHFKKSFLKKMNLSYSYLQQDKNSEMYDSRYALDYLKHKLTFGLQHGIYQNLSMNWDVVMQDRNGVYTDFVTNERVEYKPFCTVDARLQWSNNRITVFVDVANLFDVEYEDFGGLLQVGRWTKTGIRVRL